MLHLLLGLHYLALPEGQAARWATAAVLAPLEHWLLVQSEVRALLPAAWVLLGHVGLVSPGLALQQVALLPLAQVREVLLLLLLAWAVP